MRLLSARVRDYRRHRDLPIRFDPRVTVIAGPNQSGKSTLAEALHRALFLPVKTGGELLKAMQSDPFQAEPEVELSFEAAGERWELRKRFAGARGSASLRDSAGRSLQGEDAEEKLAQLIGTAAVARNRGAGDQLRERWGHLWVWQGSASSNPLALSTAGYDHDRLVERLQAGADLGVQSPLDLAVLDDIQSRWASVYTPGGANRAPQVKKGSPLHQAREAAAEAQDDLEAIRDQIAQQAAAEQAYQEAEAQLERVRQALPPLQAQRAQLDVTLKRSQELEAAITAEKPQLQAAQKERDDLGNDHTQLEELQQRVSALEAAKAPDQEALEALRQQRPVLEAARGQAQEQLEAQQQAVTQATAEATAIESLQTRLGQRQEQLRLEQQLAALAANQTRCAELQADIDRLPALTAADVETLRRLEAARREAHVRAEALSAGIEVIRAGRPVQVDGVELAAGSRQLLSEPATVQVGDDVELRLTPGDGSSAAQAATALAKAEAKFQAELQRWQLKTVDEAATAERRRSDLLAEQQRLIEQRGGADPEALRRRLEVLAQGADGQVPLDAADAALQGEALVSRQQELEQQLSAARQHRDAATKAEQQQQALLKQASTDLDGHNTRIATAEAGLRERENELLEANTRIQALQERHGSLEGLTAALAQAQERCRELQGKLAGLESELAALGAASLKAQAAALEREISTLEAQERESSDARIRAEGRLHGDGRIDLQAELEQKQAELESRLDDQERLEKEAGMLTLLRRLLEEEQNAMATQYTAPLTERIGRYLAQVFPQAPQPSLSYDARKGFAELQWRRGNEASFGFDVLSTGAREQFAAALRVTMAEVLAEAYDGTLPVLFDDAFANSDPERQAGVYRMLQQAADQGLQVILLTCDPIGCDSFADQVVVLEATARR
jgi:DNA repair exonuclease SbcCD ATPase subunit